MAKEKQEPYEFLSNLVLALMDMDRIFSNSFFTSELDISPKTLSEIRRGEDMCIYQYVLQRVPFFQLPGIGGSRNPYQI